MWAATYTVTKTTRVKEVEDCELLRAQEEEPGVTVAKDLGDTQCCRYNTVCIP